MSYSETSLPIIDTHGTKKYQLDFESGGISPAYDFWSVSIYRPPTYAKWSVHYSVGEWCQALTHGTDGSLKLYLQHTPPDSETINNWIPTPSGPYGAELRLYELPAGSTGTVHTFTLSSSEGGWVGGPPAKSMAQANNKLAQHFWNLTLH